METIALVRIVGGVLAVLFAYFLPWMIALLRHHRARVQIFVTNLVLGVTGIGWVVALIWAFSSNVEASVSLKKNET